jgi:RimJ/RimL family protein N-acetyltransferase
MSEPDELKTERLLLRPFRLTDAEDVFAYAKDPEWSHYLSSFIPSPYSRRDADEHVAKRILAPWDTRPTFAIVLDSVVVGDILLGIEESQDIGALGYGLARIHWGRGLMTEAARAVVDWGFEHRGLAKVFAKADLPNTGSWKVMEKLGMRREGLLRQEGELQGQPVDMVYYGLLREEWEAGVSRPVNRVSRRAGT